MLTETPCAVDVQGGWAAKCRELALEVLVDDDVAVAFTKVRLAHAQLAPRVDT